MPYKLIKYKEIQDEPISTDLRWGRVARHKFLKNRKEHATTADNGLLRSFCKGCGVSAKQGWGKNASGVISQRWGANTKVRSKRKGSSLKIGNAKGQPKLSSAIGY